MTAIYIRREVIMSELVSELAEKFMEGARKSGYLQIEEDTPSTFPLDCLPKDLQAYVLGLQRAEQIPVDFSAPLMLFATAASCFRKTSVKVDSNLVTPLNLYGLFIAPSGFGKTSVFEQVLKPFYDKNSELRSSSVSSGASPSKHPQLFVEDITSECLANVLAENNERTCYFSSDARKVIDVISGCYKDRGTDEALLLKIFSGDHCFIRRNNGQHINLNHPLINITVAVQPDKAMYLFRHKSLKDSGLLARFLCICGQTEPRLLPETPIKLNADLETKVHNRWKALLNENLIKKPVVIHADKEVYSLYRDYYNSIQQRLDSNENIASLIGRYPEMAIRIAGSLHMYEFPAEEPLSADTFQKAIKIQKTFFAQQQMNFIDKVYNKNQDKLLDKFYALLLENNGKVPIREAYRKLHIDKDPFVQLVEQNPSLRLDDGYVYCDNCDSN